MTDARDNPEARLNSEARLNPEAEGIPGDAHAERLSPQATDRGHRTIEVSAVFADHADEIAAGVAELSVGHVLVAVVDADYAFLGTHSVPENDMIEQIRRLEPPQGWAMVFSPGADADHVRSRTIEMAELARQRIAVIERINARRAATD
ncbi:MAG: hypothetical protein JO147_14875 [Actinobacteria bacterium]|nr:hypothetical protein [Actinomycetota bacterium]